MLELLKQVPKELFWAVGSIVVVLGSILGACSFLIYVERKLSAYMQDRVGPNRVGPWGLFQSIADGSKFILKEERTFVEVVDGTFGILPSTLKVSEC